VEQAAAHSDSAIRIVKAGDERRIRERLQSVRLKGLYISLLATMT